MMRIPTISKKNSTPAPFAEGWAVHITLFTCKTCMSVIMTWRHAYLDFHGQGHTSAKDSVHVTCTMKSNKAKGRCFFWKAANFAGLQRLCVCVVPKLLLSSCLCAHHRYEICIDHSSLYLRNYQSQSTASLYRDINFNMQDRPELRQNAMQKLIRCDPHPPVTGTY